MTRRAAPFRLLRSAALAVSALSLAAGAHLHGGGQLPAAPVLAACIALVVLGVVILTGWKLKLLELSAVLAGGQVFLHSLFSVLSPAVPDRAVLPGSVPGEPRHWPPRPCSARSCSYPRSPSFTSWPHRSRPRGEGPGTAPGPMARASAARPAGRRPNLTPGSARAPQPTAAGRRRRRACLYHWNGMERIFTKENKT